MCTKCGQELYSFTDERWSMTTCECGESSLDAELWYTREMGFVKVIDIKEFDSRDELESPRIIHPDVMCQEDENAWMEEYSNKGVISRLKRLFKNIKSK